MRALNRAGSFFLRSILKRMKSLGLNQSALARRMNVSRAYISKALAGDVNFSFSTACRFAKALEMDFLPGLAPSKKSSPKSTVNLNLQLNHE